jgi:hypothetical protein
MGTLPINVVVSPSAIIEVEIINTGPKGDTPIKGVDYFTQSDIDYFLSNAIQDKTYVHDQIPPNSIWNITHNLNKYPSVTVVNSAGSISIGEIDYISLNEISITFSAGFSGKAYLN